MTSVNHITPRLPSALSVQPFATLFNLNKRTRSACFGGGAFESLKSPEGLAKGNFPRRPHLRSGGNETEHIPPTALPCLHIAREPAARRAARSPRLPEWAGLLPAHLLRGAGLRRGVVRGQARGTLRVRRARA